MRSQAPLIDTTGITITADMTAADMITMGGIDDGRHLRRRTHSGQRQEFDGRNGHRDFARALFSGVGVIQSIDLLAHYHISAPVVEYTAQKKEHAADQILPGQESVQRCSD